MQRRIISVRHRIDIDYTSLENVLSQVDEIKAQETLPSTKEYFETDRECDYGAEYFVVYYVIDRYENDEEYANRIAAEKERTKTQEDRELEQLRYLQEKYKDK